MKNKYVMTRFKNARFLKEHLDDYLYNNMRLARYDVTFEECVNNEITSEEAKIAYQNFKNAYDSLLNDKDEIDYTYLLKLHGILMSGLMDTINNELTEEQIQLLKDMINQPVKANTEIAIDVMMMILKKRLFKDGDVRVALFFANKIMLENGCGVITVSPSLDEEFRKYLKGFHEHDEASFKNWIYTYCIRGKQVEY